MAGRRVGGAIAAACLVVAACSGGDDDDRSADVTVDTEVAATDPPVTDPPPTEPPITEPPVTEPPPTEPPPTTEPPPPPAELDDWTVLLYVMADNDLEPFLVQDVLEMTESGSSDTVNVVALVDRHPGYELEADPLGEFESTRLYYVQPGDVGIGEDVGELNFGAPETLARFIETGILNFPAERYGVIIGNHGAGWPGMGPDETDGNDILDLADMDAGFETGLAAAGVDKLDLVGFDACLMASYEVATTMADHADLMLASEELEPGHGWDYAALGVLSSRPDVTGEEFGAAMVEAFAAEAASLGTDEQLTLSLVDLRGIDALQAALDGLAAPLMAEPQIAAPILAQAQSGTLGFGRSPDPELDSNHVDLGHLAARLGASDPVLTDPAQAVIDSLDAMVVANATGPATSEASGLSIYFPPYPNNFRQGYLFLEDIPVWPALLESYYTAGAAIPETEQASFVETDGEAEYFFDEDGLNIFGTFDLAAQGNLVEAEIFYGVLDESDDSIIFIGEEPGEVSTDGSGLAGAIYDLTVLTISDGIDTDFAYLDLTIDEENELLVFDVPLWYVPPEEFETDDPYHDVVLNLVLDLEGNVLSEVYYEFEADGTAGELTADPDGLIFPIVLNQYPDGTLEWLTLSEVGLFANLPDLQYALEPLDPGTGLYAELVLTDYGGNVDSVSMFDLVPG